MTTKIRPASLQDVVAIMEIENSTNQVPWTKNQFISSMEVGHYSMVLQQYQKVIGFAIYAPIIPESHLLNIAINPVYQGQGLGEKLLEKIIFQNKFKNRELEKNYLAFSYGVLDQNFIQIDKNISRQKFQRTKFDTTETGGKNALTYVENQKIFYGSISKLNCQIITGRTHQIRVHLLSLGLPIIGDKLYQLNKEQKFRLANLPNNVRETVTSFPRQALHSHKLSFIHPKSLKEVKITCDMPDDMKDLEQNLL